MIAGWRGRKKAEEKEKERIRIMHARDAEFTFGHLTYPFHLL